MKAFYFFTGALLVSIIAVYFYFRPTPIEPSAPLPLPAAISAEEKQTVREAHRLGTTLYAVAKHAEEATPVVEEQQKKLRPVYEQIEKFIFQRLAAYSGRVTSITVIYHDPDIECTIYVKPGPEEELTEIKLTADKCVGRIIENLPMVKYLMVKNDSQVVPTRISKL
jgi:hypothetical protein